MKGIAHFISGVAAASFFPWSIRAAQDGNPLYLVLGGAFGLLPDTMDFKFYRFFYPHEIYVDPDPRQPDPQQIADAIAEGMKRALREKKTIRVKLNTIRLGADFWRQYGIRFDAEKGEVSVAIGPVVNTGQVPIPGTLERERTASAALPCRIVQTYDAVTTVDIFDGPTFAFEPSGDNEVTIHFLPWHRHFTHSFTLAAAWALLGWAIWSWKAAVVIFLGYSIHILEDQLGFMGSNLFYPFTRKRRAGLHLMRSADALPNFATVWTACLLIFWNLVRYGENLLHRISCADLLIYGGILPLGAFYLLLRLARRWGGRVEDRDLDLSSEWGDPLIG
ncbi:MAG TPA: metal-dependent hydrolase [Kiritimatiellae bacterium]|nr:metal-dependent hydrolase [Kiritimatiellia bacterium]